MTKSLRKGMKLTYLDKLFMDIHSLQKVKKGPGKGRYSRCLTILAPMNMARKVNWGDVVSKPELFVPGGLFHEAS